MRGDLGGKAWHVGRELCLSDVSPFGVGVTKAQMMGQDNGCFHSEDLQHICIKEKCCWRCVLSSLNSYLFIDVGKFSFPFPFQTPNADLLFKPLSAPGSRLRHLLMRVVPFDADIRHQLQACVGIQNPDSLLSLAKLMFSVFTLKSN